MTGGERLLYHQLRPAKLAADISGSIISTYLVWQHHFWWAMVGAFAPALLGSALVMEFADLDKLKSSRMGRYIERFMNHWVEACASADKSSCGSVRGTTNGGRFQSATLIVISAWSSGLLRSDSAVRPGD